MTSSSSMNLPPNPNPSLAPNPNLRPSISTAFKREARKKQKTERKIQKKLQEKLESLLVLESCTPPSESDPSATSNVQWPCNDPDPNPQPSGWPALHRNPQPAKPPPPPPPPLTAQQRALKQCQDLFLNNDESDDDEDEDLIKFFVDLFEKDEEFRGFYAKSWEKGDFCCLVCGGIGEKLGKRYANCVGLVQHANTVSKTKRIGAHRSFGRAVCRVLGWDVDKLPGVFDGHALVRDCDSQEDTDEVIEHKGGSKDYMEEDEDADTD